MSARIPSALGLTTALLLAAPAVHAAPPPNDAAATQQTISDIRNVGTAMWTWYKDQMAPKRSEETHKKAEAAQEEPSVDMASVPVISREELAKVLVPRYIAAIPEKDGWGHPYELHLNTQDPNAVRAMGLRSAGKDGKFSGNVYVVGPFSPSDADQDISWMDGYFIHWPQPSQGK